MARKLSLCQNSLTFLCLLLAFQFSWGFGTFPVSASASTEQDDFEMIKRDGSTIHCDMRKPCIIGGKRGIKNGQVIVFNGSQNGFKGPKRPLDKNGSKWWRQLFNIEFGSLPDDERRPPPTGVTAHVPSPRQPPHVSGSGTSQQEHSFRPLSSLYDLYRSRVQQYKKQVQSHVQLQNSVQNGLEKPTIVNRPAPAPHPIVHINGRGRPPHNQHQRGIGPRKPHGPNNKSNGEPSLLLNLNFNLPADSQKPIWSPWQRQQQQEQDGAFSEQSPTIIQSDSVNSNNQLHLNPMTLTDFMRLVIDQD